MKNKQKKITLIIPCYNEEKGIGKVIGSIPKKKLRSMGYKIDIIVIDNNSKDKTSIIAAEHGAKVLFEPNQGKGKAVLTGFKNVPRDTDIVVMIDGDNSYQATELLRIIEPIDNGFCDVVIGSRLSGKLMKHSMPYFNRLGNWFFTFLVRVFYSGNVTDVCTGYFAWKREVVEELAKYICSNGFTLEMEMITKMARMNYNISSVPITYEVREGNSSLMPLKEGYKILMTWTEHLFWKPQCFDAPQMQVNEILIENLNKTKKVA
ncbi:MAG: glycosyltransferase family 2 protein [archaeon]